jgi:hypothetical protein
MDACCEITSFLTIRQPICFTLYLENKKSRMSEQKALTEHTVHNSKKKLLQKGKNSPDLIIILFPLLCFMKIVLKTKIIKALKKVHQMNFYE